MSNAGRASAPRAAASCLQPSAQSAGEACCAGQQDGTAEQAAVFGSYAAVQLADANMLQRLGNALGKLVDGVDVQQVRVMHARQMLSRKAEIGMMLGLLAACFMRVGHILPGLLQHWLRGTPTLQGALIEAQCSCMQGAVQVQGCAAFLGDACLTNCAQFKSPYEAVRLCWPTQLLWRPFISCGMLLCNFTACSSRCNVHVCPDQAALPQADTREHACLPVPCSCMHVSPNTICRQL